MSPNTELGRKDRSQSSTLPQSTIRIETSAFEEESNLLEVADSSTSSDSEQGQPQNPRPTPFAFQPASEGLGFHPFSDGLPYSAASQGRIQKESRRSPSPAAGSAESVNTVTNRLQKALQFDPASVSRPMGRTLNSDSQSFAAQSASKSNIGSHGATLPLSKKPFPAFKPVAAQSITPKTARDALAAGATNSLSGGESAAPRGGATGFSITIDGDSPLSPYNYTKAIDSGSTRTQETTSVVGDSQASPTTQESFEVAPRATRLMAYLLDCSVNICAIVLSVGTLLYVERIPRATMLEPEVVLLCSAFVALFHWALVAAQEVAFGSTLGKKTFGISVQATAGRVFLRALLFIPSLLLGGFGILWSLIDPDNFCLHDRLAGVAPVRPKQNHSVSRT